MTIPVHRFGTLAAFADAAADAVAVAVSAVLSAKSSAVLAVPGGSTARHVLPCLARRKLDWTHVVVTLADERWVPPGHADSNEAFVRECLAPTPARMTGLFTGASTPEEALAELEERIPDPDVVLLGMGEDGHVASLFPGDPANRTTGRLAVVHRADHTRITLTPRTIGKARSVLAFTGAAKTAVFDRALAVGPAAELPVRHVLRSRTEVFIGP